MDVKKRHIVIMGLGRFGGGIGVARWFALQGDRVTVTDQLPHEKLAESIAASADITAQMAPLCAVDRFQGGKDHRSRGGCSNAAGHPDNRGRASSAEFIDFGGPRYTSRESCLKKSRSLFIHSGAHNQQVAIIQ